MAETNRRDQVFSLAKHDPQRALTLARNIKDPWFRAQALAAVARYSPDRAVKVAAEARRAAQECSDGYKRVAVRAWEIAALAGAGRSTEACRALQAALKDREHIAPVASKAEALILLLYSAASIDTKQRDLVYTALKSACGHDTHWRSKRALRDAKLVCEGKVPPRTFF
jgi:hypothetical protein